MSHTVSTEDLNEAASPYGSTPFLLYVGSSGTARVNHVTAAFTDEVGQIAITGFGRGVAKTITPETQLSLLWPPHSADGFSLIADGTGVIDDSDSLILTTTGAVLHRPAPDAGASSC